MSQISLIHCRIKKLYASLKVRLPNSPFMNKPSSRILKMTTKPIFLSHWDWGIMEAAIKHFWKVPSLRRLFRLFYNYLTNVIRLKFRDHNKNICFFQICIYTHNASYFFRINFKQINKKLVHYLFMKFICYPLCY